MGAEAETPADGTAQGAAAEPVVAPEPTPLLVLRDGLSDVVETPDALAATCAAIARGTGPVAIDAERASGYRYSARAYLVQLRREGSGTHLVDPIAFERLDPLQEAIGASEWILHAATQDLACLAEVGLRPTVLFDTELAGRLLGYPRVGLATLVETLVGRRLRKEHSAVDWSTRPLPEPWLEYAALDVEVLVELRDVLADELVETGKDDWARQEFHHLVHAAPAGPRLDPWRRTTGIHRARGRRATAAVRELWLARNELAERRDVTPGRILPDSAIVAAASSLPRDKGALLGLAGFSGRGAARYSRQWLDALNVARELPEEDLPPTGARYDGPPPARSWADRDPIAAARLTRARADLSTLADSVNLPLENLLTPDFVRRLLWEPPATDAVPSAAGDGDGATDAEDDTGEDGLEARVRERLTRLGARAWQVDLTAEVLTAAIRDGGRPDDPRPEPQSPSEPDASHQAP